MHASRVINGLGAIFTGLVLVIVLVTKFTHGAYLVVIAVPILVGLMGRSPGTTRASRTSLPDSPRHAGCRAASTPSSWCPTSTSPRYVPSPTPGRPDRPR